MTQYKAGVIDLRLHQPATRLALVEQVLDNLSPGEDVLFVFHEKPRRLPTHIHTREPGCFGIDAVSKGPEIWSLRVERLPDAAGCTKPSHERLD